MIKKLVVVLVMGLVVSACGRTPEEKVQYALDTQHPLTTEESNRATAYAKAYFNKEWITAKNTRGGLNNCKPSDSNNNGYVTCDGFVPQADGTFAQQTMFCGYSPKLIGCNNQDGTIR